jgi:hypothetical protein
MSTVSTVVNHIGAPERRSPADARLQLYTELDQLQARIAKIWSSYLNLVLTRAAYGWLLLKFTPPIPPG